MKRVGHYRQTNNCLVDWMDSKGFVRGREWGCQRLPKNQISVIRTLAARHNTSPSGMIALAFKSSDYGRDYINLSSASKHELQGQTELQLV